MVSLPSKRLCLCRSICTRPQSLGNTTSGFLAESSPQAGGGPPSPWRQATGGLRAGPNPVLTNHKVQKAAHWVRESLFTAPHSQSRLTDRRTTLSVCHMATVASTPTPICAAAASTVHRMSVLVPNREDMRGAVNETTVKMAPSVTKEQPMVMCSLRVRLIVDKAAGSTRPRAHSSRMSPKCAVLSNDNVTKGAAWPTRS